MSTFRRGRSKVWWANYFEDREENEDEAGSSSLPGSLSRFSRRRSLHTDSNRNSSSSPSSGSQKSQDSGFSDSESSSPSSCSSKDTKTENNNPVTSNEEFKFQNETENLAVTENVNSTDINSLSKLPETPASGISKPYLIRRKLQNAKIVQKSEIAESHELASSKSYSISSYLAECYFPINGFVSINENTTPTLCSDKLPNSSADAFSLNNQRFSSVNADSSNHRSTRSHTLSSLETDSRYNEHRTCFIVDELPKKNCSSNTPLSTVDGDTLHDISAETSSTSTYNEFKTEDTVKYIEKNQCQLSPGNSAGIQTTQQSNVQCKSLKTTERNESRSSILDLSYLPEPTYTSTPKKTDTNIHRICHKKLKRILPVAVEDIRNRFVDSPVAKWLFELQYHYEPECMTTLQAKRIAQHYKQKTIIHTISESTCSVQIFQNKTKVIANLFLNLYEKINTQSIDCVESHLNTLIKCIKEFIISYSQLLPRMEPSEKEDLLKLMDMCDRIRHIILSFNQQSCLTDVNILEKFFSRFVDSVLTQQIMLLTNVLDNATSESSLLNALYGITNLNLNTCRIYELITRFDGIRKLLNICVQSNSSVVRQAALRVLAIICQNSFSIRQLEKAQGLEILSSMLSDLTKEKTELYEVVSVIVQITAPWIEDDHIINGLVYNLESILNALTRLITTENSCEALLLCSAALAHISFIEPQAVFILIKLNTADYLLTAVRKLGTKASIFLQEQAATLIANMAIEPEAREHLAQHRAVGALLCFLQIKHSPMQTAAETAAAERLQHKTAIALSRLCTNPEISKQVIELKGVNRLVRLCREERERNYSDGVLVACLASLRKITANCGTDAISNLNAKELIEPRLVDSFLLYSSRQETYV